MFFQILPNQAKVMVALLALIFISTTNINAQNCDITLAHWNLEACATGSSYDNYTATTNFPANMTGGASIFSNMGHHSCTPGSTGNGMCHSIHDDCTWQDNNPNAFRFSVDVNPAADYKVTISGMNFFEAAPLNYIWLNGQTGDNDPPSKYGIRVLKDGVEIFEQIEIATTPSWSLEEFDFSGNMEFMTESAATYSFELLGYCRQANSPVGFAVWDVDEIQVIGCSELIDPCSPFGGDADSDGVCKVDDCDDNNPNISNPGDACDDGNPNTTNDMMDANCTCAGTPVTPPVDCPNLNANIGDSCDDGNANTSNDTVQANCTCSGTPVTPPVDCPNLNANIGDSCDDGNSNTNNDIVQANCTCAGTPVNPPVDCPNLNANVGDSCDDGNSNTSNDTVQANCTCSGTPVNPPVDCPNLNANVGDSCDDGNSNTTNDTVQANCTCSGTPVNPPVDCPNLNANVGDSCDDGNSNTNNDIVQANCTCAGTPVTPPVPCDAVVTANGANITVTGANGYAHSSVKVIDSNNNSVYSCSSWSNACPSTVNFTLPTTGDFWVQVQTFDANWNQICNIFQLVKNGTAPPPTYVCSIAASASNVRCDGFNTFSFDLTVNVTNGGAWGWDLVGSNIMMNPSGSTVTISGVPVGSGAAITYTVMDHDKPTCTSTFNVTPPVGPCNLLPPSDVCEATVSVVSNEISISGLTNAFNGVKVIDNNFQTIYQCDTWDATCSASDLEIILPQNGTYYVSVVTYDENWNSLCRLFEKVVFDGRDGLSAPDVGVNVFPNPAENNVNLRIDGFNDKAVEVLIINQFGAVKKSFQFQDIDGSNQELSLDGLKNGIYTVIIISEGNDPISKKLVVGKSYNNFRAH